MSEDLRDSIGRLRITPETDAMLEAIARVTGVSKHDTARDVLHRWATEQLHISTLAVRLQPREGRDGKGEGS